ncbi:SOS response-associated peptidase [Variovorax sp. PAMC26660]|uniref:SOS response-associated peptidase n=1 Tax=Variovorax sp. PAMC26660 TaxID=2762322 RepID=UPI00164DDDB2|nr:SOS response-associated peptidase family protein [Variovorax sp. PAMC26660]QNK67821.1 SOS response-associated peptidase [Variovorax sp. PAMC26660]
MCSNYETVSRADRLLSFFGVIREDDERPVLTWPTGMAPFVRLAEDGSGNRRVDDGAFGLLPGWAKELVYGKKTHNAKAETIATLPSYRTAWRMGQRCVVPAEAIFEPYYETAEGQSVRYRIQQPGEVPMGLAGIWDKWHNPETGEDLFSFAMITINADGHPVMSRFHKPGDEKRMVVILDPEDYDDWLTCPVHLAPKFLQQWMGQLDTYPAPLAPRAKKERPVGEREPKRAAKGTPKPPPPQLDLF